MNKQTHRPRQRSIPSSRRPRRAGLQRRDTGRRRRVRWEGRPERRYRAARAIPHAVRPCRRRAAGWLAGPRKRAPTEGIVTEGGDPQGLRPAQPARARSRPPAGIRPRFPFRPTRTTGRPHWTRTSIRVRERYRIGAVERRPCSRVVIVAGPTACGCVPAVF